MKKEELIKNLKESIRNIRREKGKDITYGFISITKEKGYLAHFFWDFPEAHKNVGDKNGE